MIDLHLFSWFFRRLSNVNSFFPEVRASYLFLFIMYAEYVMLEWNTNDWNLHVFVLESHKILHSAHSTINDRWWRVLFIYKIRRLFRQSSRRFAGVVLRYMLILWWSIDLTCLHSRKNPMNIGVHRDIRVMWSPHLSLICYTYVFWTWIVICWPVSVLIVLYNRSFIATLQICIQVYSIFFNGSTDFFWLSSYELNRRKHTLHTLTTQRKYLCNLI